MNVLQYIFTAALVVFSASASNEDVRNSSSLLKSSGCTYDDASYDYFLFVQQWPASQSSASWPAEANTSDWSIHGMWPSRTGSDVATYPCQCTTESFDETELKTVLGEMKTNWASYTGEDDQFWSHEWSKHGTCSTPVAKTQLDYFSKTLNTFKTVNLLSMLTDASIVPGSSYSSSDVLSALGGRAIIGCKSGKLSEVAFCLDKDDLSVISCDGTVMKNVGEFNDCSGTISYPSSGSPSPTPTPTSGKCADYGCGGVYDPTRPCQCTQTCESHDDCCPDYQSVCGGGSTQCVAGEHGPPCAVDSDCTKYDDCVRCANSGYCTCADKATGQCA